MASKSVVSVPKVLVETACFNIAPAQVLRSPLAQTGKAIAALGKRPLVIGGQRTLELINPQLAPLFEREHLTAASCSYLPDCCESSLQKLQQAVQAHQADLIIGVGGGKALDTAKLVAYKENLPIATIPTSGATCAGWTALSNVYSDRGAFEYDVPLPRCPELFILDYALIQSAPRRTLVAGIGDAIAKWYEASVSSGNATQTLTIAAVQQA
ncbi:MAG: iron-containing alcohol dehydrogenase family protein, partial [Microcystaceae cyanobacterium]